MPWSVLSHARAPVGQTLLDKLCTPVFALNLRRETGVSLLEAKLVCVGHLILLDQKQLLERLQTRETLETSTVVHPKEIAAIEEALRRMGLKLGMKLPHGLIAEFKETLEQQPAAVSE